MHNFVRNKNIMNNPYIVSFLFVLILVNPSFGRNQTFTPYVLEEEGRIVKPVQTSEGILFTDNYASSLYLEKDGKMEQVLALPNCGRDFQLSPDGSKVAFKLIDSMGMQAPAVFDISERTLNMLFQPSQLCGQPVFWGANGVAFSVENSLCFISDNKERNFVDLPNYCNQIAVHQSGNFFVWNNEDQQLILQDRVTGRKSVISPQGIPCLNPKFSTDGRKVLFNTIDGQLLIYNLADEKRYSLGQGGNASWVADSESILFTITIVEDFEVVEANLYLVDYTGRNLQQLTNTPSVLESQPTINKAGDVLFSCLNERKIFSAKLNLESKSLGAPTLLFEHPQPLPIQYYSVSNFKANRNLVDIGEMPFVHQVYDTPDFHDGSGSCGPTTAVMALASFNILPAWPTVINKILIHTNDFGSYVADKYHYNENFFDTYTSPYTSDAWGAYSYMWASGSPSSTMRNYFQLHGLTSSQSWTSYCSFQDTKDEIDDGFPQSLCHYMTTAGHITLAKGYIENQFTLLFHDPNGDKNTPNYPSYDGENVLYDWPGYNNGYQNLDATGTHGGIAWSVTTRKAPQTFNDTIVDDIDFDHGFYMFNEPPSHMKYFRDQTSGHNGHSWWTITIDSNPDVCFVTWEPTITDAGLYEISAYIPASSSDAQQVVYYISTLMNTDSVVIDQSAYSNEWALLGFYQLSSLDSVQVYLGDNTGIAGEKMVFDAIRFSRAPMVNIDEIQNKKSELKIFPNPATEEFTVAFSESASAKTIDLLSMDGRVIKTYQNSGGQGSVIIIIHDLALPSGLYMVRCFDEGKVLTGKVSVR